MIGQRPIGAPEALQIQLTKALIATLSAAGHQVVDPLLSSERDNALCSLGPCLSRLEQRTGAQWALQTVVVAIGSSYDLAFTILETFGGGVVAQSNGRCDVCNFDDVSKKVSASVEQLLEQARSYVDSRAWLVIETKPPGAEIQINGVTIGTAPLRRLMLPGQYKVRASRAALYEEQPIELTAGDRKSLRLKLRLTMPAAMPTLLDEQASKTRHWLAWSLVGGAALVGASGAALWASSASCELDCRQNRRTAGLVLLGAGAAAILTGLQVLPKAHNKPTSGLSWSVSPVDVQMRWRY